MRPRLTRTVLFLSTLSLLVLPVGDKAGATDSPGHIVGSFVGTVMRCHDQGVSHRRCSGGVLQGLNVTVVAVRTLPTTDIAMCSGPGANIPLTTRETTGEGRGRIDDTHLVLSEGAEECRVRISGRYHRIGPVYVGRLGIDVHRADGSFRHSYCVSFESKAVDPAFVATVEGIQNLDANCAAAAPLGVPPDGRLPVDGDDPQHHDTLVFTP